MLPGIIGSLQASEALKIVLGAGDTLTGRLLLFDALHTTFDEVAIRRNPRCPVCGEHPTITEYIDYVEHAQGLRRERTHDRRSDPAHVAQRVGGARQVEADGETVREVLDDLAAAIRRSARIFENGDIAPFVNDVYLGGEDVRTLDGLETSVGGATPSSFCRRWPAEPTSTIRAHRLRHARCSS